MEDKKTDSTKDKEQLSRDKNDDPGNPPPPTPPPNDDGDHPGETKDTPASPSKDNTCAGIENLCFLGNTISRLKFDCVSSLQIMSALNLANLNLNDMS